MRTTKVPLCRENGEIYGVFGIFEDITEYKRAEEQIKESLNEKEVLLKELYHRTKNNMQIIISMMDIQTLKLSDEWVLLVFKEIQDKIRSMALVHERLYQAKDLSRINLKDYFFDLVNLLKKSYKDTAKRIQFHAKMENIQVTIDSAIPCGLIMNEPLSNSLKHAFPGTREGEIRICLKTMEEGFEVQWNENVR